MEVFAGGVRQSDSFFMEFVATIDELMGAETVSPPLRHQALQLAIVFMCGVNQLSPGAYFLRLDLFPSICTLIKSPETRSFTFEAVALLSILANFHKSDSANLNIYLQRIRDVDDRDLMWNICWATSSALDAATKAYQDISDDSPPTLLASFGTFMTSLRPDRALSSTPIDTPRELFKNQPIEASLILLPIFEFLQHNGIFASVLLESLSSFTVPKSSFPPPIPLKLLSFSSYLLTHATSLSSPRATAYANLALHILLNLAENEDISLALSQPCGYDIRLCRQRLPVLPLVPPPRPPLCALLDCCILWLRHNLHKKLEVNLYITCISVCSRIIWFLQKERVRLEYHWQELWASVLGLLDFLSGKFDNPGTSRSVEILVQETLYLLGLAVRKAELILPSPQSLHEFIYELVRTSSILKKQKAVLISVSVPQAQKRTPATSHGAQENLARILKVVDFYEQQIGKSGSRTVREAMRVISREIERDGVHGIWDGQDSFYPLHHGEDVGGCIRYISTDALSLMPSP
ncbi:hypothetical protein JAAARDRAFT_147418 [Jaapia argillacea MUCL 33604]|uniref:Armadillo-like helical domain-containing protein n=1 Tax=Jaapia argillacea MUCL 33604 TaxID=933084 RepID=A0A067QAU0_9AGAM|nr:hypothetical protein JAAARDRAFT_147418 [Jaapia argillacea MUCL 33604]